MIFGKFKRPNCSLKGLVEAKQAQTATIVHTLIIVYLLTYPEYKSCNWDIIW